MKKNKPKVKDALTDEAGESADLWRKYHNLKIEMQDVARILGGYSDSCVASLAASVAARLEYLEELCGERENGCGNDCDCFHSENE